MKSWFNWTKAFSDRRFDATTTSTGTYSRRGARLTGTWTETRCCCCCCCRCRCCCCSRSKSRSRPWRRCRWWPDAASRFGTDASRTQKSEPETKSKTFLPIAKRNKGLDDFSQTKCRNKVGLRSESFLVLLWMLRGCTTQAVAGGVCQWLLVGEKQEKPQGCCTALARRSEIKSGVTETFSSSWNSG